MKTIFCLAAVLVFAGCRPSVVAPGKNKKIAVHVFTGKGEYEDTTTWFFIKKVVEPGVGGYYFVSTSKVKDFRQVNFVYSKERPDEFGQRAPFDEKLELLNPGDLPGDVLKDSSNLESLYQ